MVDGGCAAERIVREGKDYCCIMFTAILFIKLMWFRGRIAFKWKETQYSIELLQCWNSFAAVREIISMKFGFKKYYNSTFDLSWVQIKVSTETFIIYWRSRYFTHEKLLICQVFKIQKTFKIFCYVWRKIDGFCRYSIFISILLGILDQYPEGLLDHR